MKKWQLQVSISRYCIGASKKSSLVALVPIYRLTERRYCQTISRPQKRRNLKRFKNYGYKIISAKNRFLYNR